KNIASRLNENREPAPRAQLGRVQAWAPSTVRDVLFRTTYRGEIVWSRTRKRDSWGHKHQTDRPAADWVRVDAPQLRIISDDLWSRAHHRMETARALYLKANDGRTFGRPALGNPSKYLLTNLARCGLCGGSLCVRTRAHGSTRKGFYGCSSYYYRG